MTLNTTKEEYPIGRVLRRGAIVENIPHQYHLYKITLWETVLYLTVNNVWRATELVVGNDCKVDRWLWISLKRAIKHWCKFYWHTYFKEQWSE